MILILKYICLECEFEKFGDIYDICLVIKVVIMF